jgi:hypothetical protein
MGKAAHVDLDRDFLRAGGAGGENFLNFFPRGLGKEIYGNSWWVADLKARQ